MSIAIMTGVWTNSAQVGNPLLLLLAIADFANDNGIAFPAVTTLARKSRMSERQTQRVLKKLIKSGELRIRHNAGPKGTHLYQVIITVTLPLFSEEGGDILSPRQIDGGDIQGIEGVTSKVKRGDITVSPEPLNRHKNGTTGRAEPSPVSVAFKAYAEGIKRKYGGDYPPSKKANGQLANVVSRVGGPSAADVVNAYFASQNPFYAKVKHKLDVLVRDCEQIYLEMQASTPGAKPPTHARVALLKADGTVIRELEQYPAGDMEAIARRAAKEYAGAIARLEPRYVSVVQGAERRRYQPSELVGGVSLSSRHDLPAVAPR